jgi:DNA-binding YbaB/EbfC family protein
MGTGFAKRKKQAKELQQQLGKMQEEMLNTEATGSAGNGLVTITVNGDKELKAIKIKPECVDPEDIEGLEDLIKAAYSDATRQLPSPEGLPMNFPGFPR